MEIYRSWLAGCAIALAAFGFGQSFNIDLNDPGAPPEGGGGAPSSAFPGAASQPGYWNAIYAGGPSSPVTLYGLDGHPSQAQMIATGGIGSYGWDVNPNLSGDYRALLADGAFVGTPIQYRFAGFQPGQYRLYTYGCLANGEVASLHVSVPGSTTPTQTTTGPMPANQFIYGVDYCAHDLTVTGTFLEIDVSANAPPYAEILGFQIVRVGRPVSGAVNLQNYSGQVAGVQVVVEIRNPGSTTDLDVQNTILDGNGNFTIETAAAPGTYDFVVKAPHWLRQRLQSRTLSDSGVSGLSYSLVNGDVNGDNTISLGDFAQLRAAFGSSSGSSNWNANADLNGDGSVTLGDFAILRANYGRQGDP